MPWLKLPTGGHGHVICMCNLRWYFSHENTPESHTETHKSSYIPYKQVSVRNGDQKWLRITNAFILCDLVWIVQNRYAANRESSFKLTLACFRYIFRQSPKFGEYPKMHIFLSQINDNIQKISVSCDNIVWCYHNQFPLTVVLQTFTMMHNW